MDLKVLAKYQPMTETAFYILLCLQEENHGYQITKEVAQLTQGAVNIGPGTMYGSLSKFEEDGLIMMTQQVDQRNYYQLTSLGREVLWNEFKRIDRLYHHSQTLGGYS